MACSIKTNSSGVQQVLAPNGERSLLFDSIMALPFVKDENDALLYHTAMSKYANDSYFTDQNGEPIMVFINSEDNNMLRIPDRVVATESYTAARGSVLSNRNVEVGVVKKSDPLELPAMFNRREWFENTRNQAMNTEKQVVSTAATGTKFFVLPSKNDFVSVALTNISSNEVSLVGLQNRLINNEYISTERTSLKEAERVAEESIQETVEEDEVQVEVSETKTQNKMSLKIDGVNLSQISVSKAVKREDTDVFTVKRIKLDMPVSPNAYIETFAAATQEMINRAGKNIALTVDVSKLNESARVALQNLTKQGVARQIAESTYEIFEVPPQTVSGKDINLTVNEMIKENKIEARCRI